MFSKKYRCIAIHIGPKCNLNCSFCYVDKSVPVILDENFYIDSIPYLAKITSQVALGGGEPLMYSKFLKNFSTECKKHKLICNMTTNGVMLDYMSESDIKDILGNFTMISVSLDTKKVQDFNVFADRCKDLRKCGIIVGANFLLECIDKSTLSIINALPQYVDYVYLLHPKNFKMQGELLDYAESLGLLSYLWKDKIYTDDLMNKILSEGYDWKTPCHYGKDLVSIFWDGNVYGCSFSKEPLLKLTEPKDILKLKFIKYEARTLCPYLVK